MVENEIGVSKRKVEVWDLDADAFAGGEDALEGGPAAGTDPLEHRRCAHRPSTHSATDEALHRANPLAWGARSERLGAVGSSGV